MLEGYSQGRQRDSSAGPFCATGSAMKSALEVLRMKEMEVQKVRKEIEALRLTARLLEDDPARVADSSQRPQLVDLP